MSEVPDAGLTLVLPDSLLECIAERAAGIALSRLCETGASHSPYMSVREAAEHIRSRPQRIYDLLSSGRLTRHKDGRRVLVSRIELDAYLEDGARRVAPTLPLLSTTRMDKGFGV